MAGLWATALRNRKSAAAIEAEALEDTSHGGAKLSLLDLLCIGIGSTVGSGVFILTGDVLPKAGPSASLSWLIAGLVCVLSALSYLELSVRIPTSGSCYAFSHHALGELAGVVGAVCLTMEYGISGAGVARGWSSLLASLTGRGTFIWYPGVDSETATNDLYFDWAAGALVALAVMVCSSGLRLGKVIVNTFTFAKILLVIFLVGTGLAAWNVDIFASSEAYFPHGLRGTAKGVSLLFFGFIGFDEVCCLAGKAERPAHTVPRALVGTLLATTVISTLAQFALSAMAGPDLYASGAPVHWPNAFASHGWQWARVIANVGEVVLLPLVVLLSILPQPELLASLAKDGLIHAAFARCSEGGTYVWGSNVSGAFFVLVAAAVPFNVLWNMISLGVLLSFNLTNTSLIMVRYGNGGSVRQPGVCQLVAALWATAVAGSYTFWKGFAAPALDGGEEVSWAALVIGLLFLLLAVGAMCLINRYPEAADNETLKSFQAPGVPFVPGIAIILNFMLMATMEWWDHLYLLVVVLICVAAYALARRKSLLLAENGKAEQESSEVSSSTTPTGDLCKV